MAATLLLNVRQALIQFGDKVLFEDLSFTICERDKICLVGKNGAGKTTLMNIITGRRDVDGGDRWQLQGSTIGYLQQDVEFKPKQTIQEYVFEALNNQDGSHDYKIERVIEPLQLDPQQPMGQLSGGQLRRAALAKALVEEPDILLLDEPTNHLDLDIIEWLEDYLKAYRGAVICISHDKTFLANISDKVFWLDRGRLKICPRGFDFFDEWSTMILEQEERELHNRQKVLDQEVEWASRGVKARRKRNVRRVELMKTERDKLRVDKNALKRMLAKIEIEPMETTEAASRIAIDFWNVSKTYMDEGREKTILEKFYLRILRGERIGVLGKNGSGKTTFLKLLVGELTPDTGKVKLARDLTWSYFDQNRRDLQGDHSLHRVLSPNGSDYIDVMGKDRHVCGYLKDFLFDPKMVNHPVSTLSGGQKNRLLLARILANPGGLLILDEPTNDLDMETLDMLEEILASYTGTLIVVSHDRDFLEQTVTKILAFEGNGKIDAVVGGYKDYAAKRAQQAEAALKPSVAPTATFASTNTVPRSSVSPLTSSKTSGAKLTYIQQYELEQLPQRIHALEIEIATLEKGLADPDLYSRDAEEWRRVSKAHATGKEKLKTSEERWLELEEMRLALERQASVQ